jgi:hypothetical protein
VQTGLELARTHGSKVYAVYVVDTVTFTSVPMDVTWENMYQLLKEEGEAAVGRVKEAAGTGADVETHVLEGNPALEITLVRQGQRRQPHRRRHPGQERHRPHPAGQRGGEGRAHRSVSGPCHQEPETKWQINKYVY